MLVSRQPARQSHPPEDKCSVCLSAAPASSSGLLTTLQKLSSHPSDPSTEPLLRTTLSDDDVDDHSGADHDGDAPTYLLCGSLRSRCVDVDKLKSSNQCPDIPETCSVDHASRTEAADQLLRERLQDCAVAETAGAKFRVRQEQTAKKAKKPGGRRSVPLE